MFPSYRLFMSLLSSFGLFMVYAMRVNMSVAIVKMTTQQPYNYSLAACNFDGSPNETEPGNIGDFDWSPSMQGFILSAFFYGYLVAQFPAGMLASKFGGFLTFGLSIGLTALFTLLTQAAAVASVWTLVALRVLEGMSEGLSYPGISSCLNNWMPAGEKTVLLMLSFNGAQFGTIISQIVSGWLSGIDLWGGWPLAFYFWAIMGLLWCPLWWVFGSEVPESNRFISKHELDYIVNTRNATNVEKNSDIPWLKIFTSLTLWNYGWVVVLFNFPFIMLLTSMPTYLVNVLGFTLTESGSYSALAYVVLIVTNMASSAATDHLRAHTALTTIQVRKMAGSLGMLFGGMCCFMVRLAGCSKGGAVFLLCLSMTGYGMIQPQICCNLLELVPNKRFFGPTFGFWNMFGQVSAIIAPYVTGVLVSSNEHSADNWQHVFDLSGATYVAAGVAWFLIARAGPLPWATPTGFTDDQSLINASDSSDD